ARGRLALMDALLLDAAHRHGIRAADGLQLVSAANLVRLPFDPAMALLIVPADGASNADADGAPATASANAGTAPAHAATGNADADAVPADAAPATAPADAATADAATADAAPLHPDGFEPNVLPGRGAMSADPLTLLRRLYPADHLVLGLGDHADTTLSDLDPGALAAGGWVLPALRWEAALTSPHALPWLAARLRAPDGCPWDREQDHRTLRKFLLEESYEVYDALDAGSTPELAEELGDLLLQIVLHAQYAAEAGVFDLSDVYAGIMSKIVRRHPHVFGDVKADTAQEVIRNWESIKANERADEAAQSAQASQSASSEPGAVAAPTRPSDPDMPGAFAGLSRSLPALAYANEMQERAAGLGYDWPDVAGVIDKLEEEAVELLEATDQAGRDEEYGDLLFVVVNLGRKLGVDPEASLRQASRKFAARFAKVERFAAAEGLRLRALDLDGLDELWQRAKAQEREEAAMAGTKA
ncbi:MAG: nucleoside triphosphate pyrophosphohydrolase, partial [Candidatus Limnocylindrales bacterium]